MTYIRITPNNYAFIPRPEWTGEEGQPLTDEELAQQGVYKVVDEKPIYDARTHKIRKTNARQWPVVDDIYYAEYELIPIPLNTIKERMKEAVTVKRWDVMTGGLTLPNGVRVGTEIDDQNRITSVVANAELAGMVDEDVVDFKAQTGWVRITIGEVKEIAGLIGRFVQDCYKTEREHHDIIDSLDSAEELVNFDIDSLWLTKKR